MNKELLLEYAAELAKTNTTIETYYKQYLLREKNLFDAILQIIIEDEAKAAKEYEQAKKEYERMRNIKQTLIESTTEQAKGEPVAMQPTDRDYKTIYILPPQSGATCRKCNSALHYTEIPIYVYPDNVSSDSTYTKRINVLNCIKCKAIYARPNILDALDKEVGIANTNIRAIQAANGGTTCRWFNCQSTDIYRDGLCQYHYNEEHANSK
nr:MAG TPA: hypothetical protein [Caudoviricetes sp.]